MLGGGAWGTALALHLARNGFTVRLWMRDRELVERMRARRDNPVYLPGFHLPEAITPHTDPEAVLRGTRLVIGALPSAHARGVWRTVGRAIERDATVVVATKGIEEGTLALPLEVVAGELGPDRVLTVLSGPSFAREVAEGRPAAAVVAAGPIAAAQEVQVALSARALRLYANGDPRGVQVAGAVKNVIAIAAGIADSLSMGANARAGLITRGLAEITRLGLALGGRPATFAGLAGLGDLVLTCTGELSRNRRLGQRLGLGERLQDILSAGRAIAEGVPTARSARELARRAGVAMPIVEEVHRVLYEDGVPQESLERLLARPLTVEEGTEER